MIFNLVSEKSLNKDWYKWYAWYPIIVKNKLVWLEWVYRKTTFYYDGPLHEYLFLWDIEDPR